MEPTIKDKYIILGFIGVAICLISFFITLIVSASFNQDNFVRLIVFVCSNILGWLLYLSFQTVISTHTRSGNSSPARKRHLPES